MWKTLTTREVRSIKARHRYATDPQRRAAVKASYKRWQEKNRTWYNLYMREYLLTYRKRRKSLADD